ncbi:MAG: PAS domain S-box protein [Methanobacterium sp.]
MIIKNEKSADKKSSKKINEKISTKNIEKFIDSKEHLDIINFLPDATFVINSEGQVIAWNQAMEDMTHVKADEMLGKNNYEYSIPFYGERRKILIDIVLTNEKNESMYDHIWRENSSITGDIFLNLDGKPTYLWGKAATFYNQNGEIEGAIESIRDITEKQLAVIELKKHRDHLEELVEERTEDLKKINLELQDEIIERQRMEEEIIKSEEKSRLLIKYAPSMIYEIDYTTPKFITVNDAMCSKLGYTREELLKMNPLDLLEDNNKKILEDRLKKTQAGENIPESTEYKVRDKDGRTLYGLLNMSFSYKEGKPVGALVVAQDITDRKLAEIKLEETMERLKSSNQELEKFAYVASHDLQEPLRMVSSFTQLLEKQYKDKLDNEANEYINFIVNGAKRMQELINDLLAYSRVTNKAYIFEKVDLEKVLDDAIFNQEINIEKNQAIITREPLPEIIGDYSQMVQVFQNLLGNALKYRGKRIPRINFSALKNVGNWLISVQDNGIGIEPENFDEIFKMFRRLHTIDEYNGTGIGLSICKKIIERHGGKIWVESKLGKGSTFYFTIPFIYNP